MIKKFFTLSTALSAVILFGQNDSIQYDIVERDTIGIQEVLIQSQRKKMFADKAVYTFDQAALDQARYAKDLLATLPEIRYDPIGRTIQSIKGGTLLILINGIEASDAQIRSVKPENVIRVEYYDIPPARWANRAETVVNLITRNPENGYVYGVDLGSTPMTGFVNGTAYAEITRGKNNFGFDYSINLRDYDNRENKNSYAYLLDQKRYRTEEFRKDHFGYTDQEIALRYTNIDPEKYSFQAKLFLSIFSSFSKVNGNSTFAIEDAVTDHTTSKHSNSSYNKPTLDLYYSRHLGKRDEVSLNIIGSRYNTKSFNLSKEWVTATEQSVFDDHMNLEAEQTGIVGEIAHSRTFEKGQLNSGYRISSNTIANTIHNLEGFSENKIRLTEQYFYTEFSGKTDQFMYRLSLGLNNIHNSIKELTANNTTNTDYWTILPKLVLGYELTKRQSLRLTSSYAPTSPWSGALSTNVVQIAPNLVRRGNPTLEIQKSLNNNLTYSFNSKYVDLNTNLFYKYNKDAFNQLYVKNYKNNELPTESDLVGYALTYENARYSQHYGFQITGSIKPFGNELLTARIVLTPARESIKTKDGKTIKNDYIGNYFGLSSVYKSLSVNYQFNIPYYTLNGANVSTAENMNHFFVGYKVNNWSFNTGIYWIGMPSEYKTKSLDNSFVQYTSHTKIHNNKTMFAAGFSYDFATGKKNNLKKKLNNDTAPAATF